MLRWWVEAPRIHFLAIGWALVILILSATPGDDLPKFAFKHLDKILHALVYGVLGILVAFSFRSIGIGNLFLVLTLVIAYGFIIEWLQGTFFEGRYFDTFDGLANSAGAVFGIVIFKRLDRTL